MPIVEISMVNLLPTKIARLVEQAADHSSSGNPEGISKECGKDGKPASWLSMLSILCHFHGLLWNAFHKVTIRREGPFWEQGRLVRNADLNEAAGAADTALMCSRERRWLR
jgi:hypothetical protein